jgi:hypothetical protein
MCTVSRVRKNAADRNVGGGEGELIFDLVFLKKNISTH